MSSEMKRLKQREEANSRMTRIVANLTPDKEMLQDVIRQKLHGLRHVESWWTLSGRSGRSAYGTTETSCGRIDQPITARPHFVAGRSEAADPRDCRDARALRLQANSRAAPRRSLRSECQKGLPTVSRGRLAVAD